jgi:hypothetical protein
MVRACAWIFWVQSPIETNRRNKMKKLALAIWPQVVPDPAIEKPVLVKFPEEQWKHEEAILERVRLKECENHREKVQRLVPGMDLKRWI